MKLHNTLSSKIEDFIPINDNKVKMFVCGPTVYDYSHIGHAKTYIQMDTLARVLRANNYDVFYLQNITDIDDKIIARAKESEKDWQELRSEFEQEYFKDMASLNNTSVDKYARATDYIDNILTQVQTLIDKGHAYKIDEDGIYFEIATFPDYGKLSKRTDVKEDDAQSRIDQSDQKRGWNDFCLWKFSKPGEPVWEAPFGQGRPGWHIEDTAITEKHFGPQYDIHGGAIDLIFPHHEAELTQMESASGKTPFVKYWVHSGFLTIDGSRMGKSKGNFITIREILDKGYDPMSIRLLMLQSNYRSSVSFSWDLLDSATERLKTLRATADLRYQVFDAGKINVHRIETAKTKINAALVDDLNLPNAMAVLSTLITDIDSGGINTACKESYLEFIKWLDAVFGLNLGESKDISDEAKRTIKRREQARADKDWKLADELRQELADQGITIKDTDLGSIWLR